MCVCVCVCAYNEQRNKCTYRTKKKKNHCHTMYITQQ